MSTTTATAKARLHTSSRRSGMEHRRTSVSITTRRFARSTVVAAGDAGGNASTDTTETNKKEKEKEKEKEVTDTETERAGEEVEVTEEKFTNKDAFQALTNLAGKEGGGAFGGGASAASPFGGANTGSSNPFAMSSGGGATIGAAPAAGPAGFVADGVDKTDLPPKGDADRLLMRFDRDQRKGTLPGEDTPEGSPQCTHPPLRASCRTLASLSSRVMMGICAADAEEGLSALKAWTADLGLPKGKLHGLDVDGVPVEPPKGPVFIKYNSDSGDAFLSGYGGEYRGVLFTPELGDGAFRQYGYLPLDLPTGGAKC